MFTRRFESDSQLVAETPKHHERDHVGRVLGPVQNSVTPFVESFATGVHLKRR